MRFLVVTAIVLACQSAHAQVATIEFGPEVPGAVDAGAAAVKDALKLTKDPANKWKAVFAFKKIAADWPAALHDCYLSLAELRVGTLTEAKLVWDRAVARGGERPKWCTGDVANQLAKALRDGKFVEITIVVTPADALILWNGTLQIRGVPSLWVKQEVNSPFTVSAPGFVTAGVRVPMTATGGRLEVALQPEAKPVPLATDAGVPTAPVDAPPVAPDAPAHVAVIQPPPPEDPDERPHRKIPYRTIAIGVGIVSTAAAATALFMTHYESNKGNELYRSDPTFQESRDLYTEFGAATIVFSAFAVASFVAALALPSSASKPAVTIAQPPGGGVVFGLSGTFGADR